MKLSDGVIVLIITACAYLFSYSYSFGYFTAKEIPIEFINISLISLLKMGFALIGIFCLLSNLMDFIFSQDDDIIISDEVKRFLIRNSIGFLTAFLFLFDFFLKLDFVKLILFILLVYITVVIEFDVKEMTGNRIIYKKRYSFKLKKPKPLASLRVAEKLNVRIYYIYLTWFLASFFLMYNLGSVSASLMHERLMCNKDMYVVQMNDDSALVTKNYKDFSFIEKTECNFTIIKPTSKKNI